MTWLTSAQEAKQLVGGLKPGTLTFFFNLLFHSILVKIYFRYYFSSSLIPQLLSFAYLVTNNSLLSFGVSVNF